MTIGEMLVYANESGGMKKFSTLSEAQLYQKEISLNDQNAVARLLGE